MVGQSDQVVTIVGLLLQLTSVFVRLVKNTISPRWVSFGRDLTIFAWLSLVRRREKNLAFFKPRYFPDFHLEYQLIVEQKVLKHVFLNRSQNRNDIAVQSVIQVTKQHSAIDS